MSSVIDTLVYDRVPGATYGYQDMNRVAEAMEYVAQRLRTYGYDVTVAPERFSRTDKPTLAVFTHYLQQIKKIREALTLFITTPPVPGVTAERDWVTVQDANDIEKILVDVEAAIKLILGSAHHCGQFTGWVGPTLPLPSSGGLTPRTWEELDALGWGWDVWNRLTWYQLLYEDPNEVMK